MCGAAAERQCGICTDRYLCGKEACFEGSHPENERKEHHASLGTLGVLGCCEHHPAYKLHWMCTHAGCDRALVCIRCQHHGAHAGHSFVDVLYAQAEARETLHQSMLAVASARELAETQLSDLQANSSSTSEAELSSELARVCLGLEEAVMRRCTAAAEEVGRVTLQRNCDILRLTHVISDLKSIAEDGDRIYDSGPAQVVTQTPRICENAQHALHDTLQLHPVVHTISAEGLLDKVQTQEPFLFVRHSSSELCELAVHSDNKAVTLDGKQLSAVELYKKAIDLDPNNSLAFRNLATALPNGGSTTLEDGTTMSRPALFKRAIALDPHCATAYYNAAVVLPEGGEMLLEDGTVMTQGDLYKRAITLRPDWNLAYNNLGATLPANAATELEDGSIMTQVQLFRKAVSLPPRISSAYNNLGNALPDNGCVTAEDGTVVTQAQLFKRAISLDNRNSNAYNNLGAILRDGASARLEDGRVMTKGALFKKAIALDPAYGLAWNNLGVTLPNDGSTALEDGTVVTKAALFKRAIALDPFHAAAFGNLAAMLPENGVVRMEDGAAMTKAALLQTAAGLLRAEE